MFLLGQAVVVAGGHCVCWNYSCLFFAATMVLSISLLWSLPAFFSLAFNLSLLPRLKVPDFSLQVTLGSWPTPFLAAPPMTATTTARLVGVSAQACWSPPPVASSAAPGVGSRATCPADVGESGGQHTVTKLLFPQPPCPRMLNSGWPAGTLTKGYFFLEYRLKYVHTK